MSEVYLKEFNLTKLPENYHTLTPDDFSDANAPEKLAPWTFPDKVTRPNFVPFLVDSFMKSRGVPEVHTIRLKVIAARTGFDIFEAFDAFTERGWGGLSKLEQGYFLREFNNATTYGTHGERNQQEKLRLIDDELWAIGARLTGPTIKRIEADHWQKINYLTIDEESLEERLGYMTRSYHAHKLSNLYDT